MGSTNKKFTVGKKQDVFVRYTSDLSDGNMKDFDVVFGGMEVRDGALRINKDATKGHATTLVNLDNRADYVFEADLIAQKGGGIFFCGSAGRAKESNEENDYTNGYYAFIGADGDKRCGKGIYIPPKQAETHKNYDHNWHKEENKTIGH